MGDVPLEWYKDELHVGYDRDGRRVLRGPRRDRMDRLLAQADGGAGWRTVYDDYNGEEIVLSKEEFRMIQRVREGRFPHVEVTSPYAFMMQRVAAPAVLLVAAGAPPEVASLQQTVWAACVSLEAVAAASTRPVT